MNKKTFMCALFAALIVAMPSAELQAVKPTTKRSRIKKAATPAQNNQVKQAETTQLNDPQRSIQQEITADASEQTPTLSETWGKVLRLKWTSLNRQDAKNIGETFVVMATGYGAYKLYAAYNATAPRFNGPAGVGPHTPQPPMPPAPRNEPQPNFASSAPRFEHARRTSFGHNTAVDQQTQTLHDLLDQEAKYRRHGQAVPAWLTKSIREIFKDSTQDIEPSLLHESSDSDEVGIPSPSQPSEPTPSNKYKSEAAPTHPVEPIECPICMEDTGAHDQIRLQCGHTYCTDCLTAQIDLGLKEQNTAYIKCPDPRCKKRKLDPQEIQRILKNNQYKMNKYYDITFKEFYTGNQDIKHCPTPDCSYAFVHGAHDQRQQVQCPSCKAQYCSNCLHNHAHNTTCQEAEIQRNPSAAEKASTDWIKKNAKNCPNCGHAIQKTMGCNRMSCSQCRHEFCWECLKEWNAAGGYNHTCALGDFGLGNIFNQQLQQPHRNGGVIFNPNNQDIAPHILDLAELFAGFDIFRNI
ncbi:MAG TPA: IBR domain-containing protein [Candidatus Dependentiae bacterium]|nr:IBR domain-containing protein [Candidatus Dependentiae bacterium]HRQ63147.1 IBR domain-containing protein [Candidatus Dependentiae bacterium]